jgi:hypothetical protein
LEKEGEKVGKSFSDLCDRLFSSRLVRDNIELTHKSLFVYFLLKHNSIKLSNKFLNGKTSRLSCH